MTANVISVVGGRPFAGGTDTVRLVELSRLRSPLAVDAVTAVGMTVLGLIALRSITSVLEANDADLPAGWLSVLLVCATTVPLALRRRYPLSVLTIVALSFTVHRWLGVAEFDMSTLGLFLAIYSAGVYGGRWRSPVRAVMILPSSSLLIYDLIVIDGEVVDGDILWIRLSNIALNAVFFAVAWWLGDASRRRRQIEADLVARTEELEVEREENARRAVLDERVRIARELHDVVAHHVSVMGLQAGAARRAFGQDPDAARGALLNVEASGREAVRELHQLLGFLREDEGGADAPQPGLDGLPALVDQVEDAGLTVDLEVEAGLDVPASVGLSVYRIVQESLTNSLRHGRAIRAKVEVRALDDAVSVTVDDDGAGATVNGGPSGGHGLVGMRERAALHHGRFDAGPRSEGGWRVEAVLAVPGGGR